MANKSLLVVGAGGFIGGFIAQRGLESGYDTYVAVRQSTSRRYLTDPRLKFVVLDYDNPDAVERSLRESLPESGRWDYIIWNLGATKCADFADFNRINYLYVKDFIDVIRRMKILPHRFLYMSSLSALGPADEKNYTPLSSRTIPMPNTRYGVSKIKTETMLEASSDLDWIIFRPTGVYGPHEKDYLMMIQCIDAHWDFGVGYRRQMLTFIYVDDLVDAMFKAFDADVNKKKYIISEDRSYTQKEFRDIVARALNRRFVIPVKLPMWIVYVASVIAEKIAVAQAKASTLNRDKFKIMKQRNWNCDISDAKRDFGFAPQYPLERGISETVAAYIASKSKK
jgi:nucleoside-diphosphate-sugar epimerase